jgi:hypothetical protein
LTDDAKRTEDSGDVEHDERALREAEEKMGLRDEDSAEDKKGAKRAAGDGEHDEGALREASERMLRRDDPS